MSLLQEFHDRFNEGIDWSKIIPADVDAMSSKFTGQHLYKYYPEKRIIFFDDPTIRFTPKAELNDPFELSKRWKEFSPENVSRFLHKTIELSLLTLLNRQDILLEALSEEVKKQRGFALTISERNLAKVSLNSELGRTQINLIRENMIAALGPMIEYIFQQMNYRFDEVIVDLTNRTRIFSVSETALSQQMWGLYASSGSGFVVAFNPDHEFFRTAGDKKMDHNLFQKVHYLDHINPTFWENPYFMFLVKDSGWAFEKEWRMLKVLEKEQTGDLSSEIFSVRKGMISSIIFGHRWGRREIDIAMSKLMNVDPNIQMKRQIINSSALSIEIEE